jgi:hypothetical protein
MVLVLMVPLVFQRAPALMAFQMNEALFVLVPMAFQTALACQMNAVLSAQVLMVFQHGQVSLTAQVCQTYVVALPVLMVSPPEKDFHLIEKAC